jgi:hypothetical protein
MRDLIKALPVAALALFVGVSAMGGCSAAANDPDSDELVGADENADVGEMGVSGDLAVGTELTATANVNLRSGPSTSDSILHVVASGSKVTIVATGSTDGFYKVSHNGTTGWSSGKYYSVSSSGSYGSCSVGGVTGSCIDVGSCGAGHKATPGYCPGASNIQCCTADSGDPDPGNGSSPDVEGAMARAQSGKGFSYWWGHGRFREEGPTSSNKGSCSGSCPNCSHSGSYGGDCSGYVAKIWQVPASNDDLTEDSHPYSTATFNQSSSLWSTVSRDNLKKADALVYNSGGAGHIFLYESGDGWGSMYAYECKGCSYGCVSGYRTAGNSYHGIRRKGY